MIDAGLPLVQCLQILGKQQSNPTFKAVLTTIQNDVETGTTLADSMRKHPKVFDSLYANMIEAGELGGILDTILSRLAAFKEKSMALQKKIKGAMTYPAICLAISIHPDGHSGFCHPGFCRDVCKHGLKVAGCYPTCCRHEQFRQNNIFFLGMVFYFLWSEKNLQYGKRSIKIDSFILGHLLSVPDRKVAVSKFTRTLSTMLQSGVPILDAYRWWREPPAIKLLSGRFSGR
jgi:type IV pilus assembly protein PilC